MVDASLNTACTELRTVLKQAETTGPPKNRETGNLTKTIKQKNWNTLVKVVLLTFKTDSPDPHLSKFPGEHQQSLGDSSRWTRSAVSLDKGCIELVGYEVSHQNIRFGMKTGLLPTPHVWGVNWRSLDPSVNIIYLQ